MGQGLGLALKRRGYAVVLIARSPKEVPPALVLHTGGLAAGIGDAELVLIATPDDALASVAQQLATSQAITRNQVVLHLSGVLDRSVLGVLDPTGAALGSFHPLQTVADPVSAADRLKGAYAGIEGDERAVAAAERLANTLRMIPVRLTAEAKARYHAGATFAANYAVVLMRIAERLAREGGVAADVASQMYLPLLNGAVANISKLGVAEALTGPVRRGDLETLRLHLAALRGPYSELYRRLGLEALDIAKEAGLDETAAKKVAQQLKAPATDL